LVRPTISLALIFANLGHLYVHMFTAFYFIIILSIESAWELPYHQLIKLWAPGALMVGLAALPAGWLADRWSAPGTLALFFIGLGISTLFAGFASTPLELLISLTGVGLFASIYHPVAIPWLIRNTDRNPGKALGFNGIFGSLGVALSALVAGLLVEAFGWRSAFLLPGLIALATGLFFLWALLTRRIGDRLPREDQAESKGRSHLSIFLLLLLVMFIGGLIYQSTQTVLPKVFELRASNILGSGYTEIGLLVTAVYTASAAMQLVVGHLADRFPLKRLYLLMLLAQIPLLWFAADLSGGMLIAITALMVIANTGALPAENLLLAQYTPAQHHGLAFGAKFTLVFGAGPIAVTLIAYFHQQSGEFHQLFTLLALLAGLGALTIALLPRKEKVRSTLAP